MQQKIFTEASTRRRVSPWGAEVKNRLTDLRMLQDELVSTLQAQGFQIDKGALCNLLYGIGISNRRDEIEEISRILDIPYQPGIADRPRAIPSGKEVNPYEGTDISTSKPHLDAPRTV